MSDPDRIAAGDPNAINIHPTHSYRKGHPTMTMRAKPKKKTDGAKNQQDATLRNIRALKKRVEVMEERIAAILERLLPPPGVRWPSVPSRRKGRGDA